MGNVSNLLVSGLATIRVVFSMRCPMLNFIDMRGDTSRFTCFDEDLLGAIEVAKTEGLTLQRIVSDGEDECYETLYQADHPGWSSSVEEKSDG